MTIYDIAKEAGVSASTVSRVLNGREGISEETRKRVLAIAEGSGFELSESARSLATNSSRLIGILVSDIRNQHYTEGAYVMVEEFQKMGYCSIIMHAGSDDESKGRALRLLSSRRVDGVVMIGSSFSSESVASAVSTYMPNTPIVMENGFLPLDNAYSVIADDKGGLISAVQYLKDRGVRAFCYINANDTPSNRLKKEGVRTVLDDCTFLETEDSFEGGYKAAKAFFSENRADAVICSMDIIACGAERAILDSGYAIPDDVLLFGVDNSLYSAIASPSISSIDTSLKAMSIECVRVMELALEGKEAPKRTMLPFRLVLRESTG